jgi:pSer/pThr/pTyr-binding forkhead associated (FHA) protein
MFKLVIQDDEGKTTVVPLIRDEITIGRKEGNTIRLTERNVSRRHARILRNNGEVHIEDLGSYNGIRVNNARIAERVSLRVSDQVQIGDYKLYLKAEGVEQVDDARTMPIERVDTANTTTDVMPAATSVPAPTAPMPIQTPAPGTLPPAAQLIGNPNRTLVAVADTDPQGRPVASPAQVAAVLSSPVGYGKLVVLSSNFAGKEFELSRPQMIIGRTDENDIVINHRSISRNHAKLVREPETGRYTISDLQSSNGVRVNGQDYGKVELRRGDVVDLGHVRLRFVEPGEDFVFSRDAVITDVPDSSSKKTLLVAIVIAVVVVASVVIFMVMRSGGEKTTKNGSNDQIAVADAGTQIAVNPVDAVEAVTQETDATQAVAPTDTLRVECKEAADKQRWADLIACAEKLQKVDKLIGDRLYKIGHDEQRAEVSDRALTDALKNDDWKAAKTALESIPQESVYSKPAIDRVKEAEDKAIEKLAGTLEKQKSKDCKGYEIAVKQANGTLPKSVIEGAKKKVPCTAVVAIKDNPKDNPKETPKPDPCAGIDETSQKAMDAFSGNSPEKALPLFEAVFKCKGDASTMKLVFASACKAKNVAKAKAYWKKMSSSLQGSVAGFCVDRGITYDILNAP